MIERDQLPFVRSRTASPEVGGSGVDRSGLRTLGYAAALLGSALMFGSTFSSCSGGSSGGSGGPGGSRTLVKVEYGRLVDIYAYRRIDETEDDRRAVFNRQPFLIARDVVVGPDLETDPLFDSVGEARPTADFRFQSFDVAVGHDELLILWDDRLESERFQAAYSEATGSLVEVAAAWRGQNVLTRPIPVVPRDAAFLLTFSSPLGVDDALFVTNPSAVQVLRFRDDPNVVPAPQAFVPADVRILAREEQLIIDTTIIGGESIGRRVSTGLDPSEDQLTANYRIAIPTGGVLGRLLDVSPDPIADQNGVDSAGDTAVIRDFRSGNASDGEVGSLADFEAPAIIAQKSMGIVTVDPATRIVTLNKRGAAVVLRGRTPFVDGVVDADSNLPKGPLSVPLVNSNGNPEPLPHGDFVRQVVMSSAGEAVVIRAEIVQNLQVGTIEGDATFPGPGLTPGGTQGEDLQVVRVRLATVEGFDSMGNRVTLASLAGAGADCTVTSRYYESMRTAQGSVLTTDADRRREFFVLEPAPTDANGDPLPPGAPLINVQPTARFAVRFSEPMDLSVVSSFDNYVLTTEDCGVNDFQAALDSPKSASLSFLQADLIDQRGDGTLLQLAPRLGLYHENGSEESYWFHVDVGPRGVTDLAGNVLDLYDRPEIANRDPLQNFSVTFDLDAAAADNFVGSRVFRFEDFDEDGTPPGSIDFFGQFQLIDGRLYASPVSRRSRTADNQNLGAIQRWDKGECVQPANNMTMTPPVSIPPGTNPPGVLYQTPSMTNVAPPPLAFQPSNGAYGGLTEPHTTYGARLMMTYREDDFDLDYHNANDLNIDVEQMHWAPWSDQTVLFDRFDRYTMALGHSKKRPDLLYSLFTDMMAMTSTCAFDCLSLFSGLELTYLNNVLPGSSMVNVVTDKEYVINPNDAFRSDSDVKYMPYPEFARTYTWRDSRIVSWDMQLDQAIGLGGSQDADSDPPEGDRTASISSPWISNDPASAFITQPSDGWVFTELVRDQGDFLGDRTKDHDPIALPLLVDISVWPDDTQQVATAANQMHIALVGPNNQGYYNSAFTVTTTNPPDPFNCTAIETPYFRIYTVGGQDLNIPGQVNTIEPDLQTVARGGVIKDMALGDATFGLFQSKPGDSTTYWAQMDLVRRVSLVTFGFFDTLQPNKHALRLLSPPIGGPLPATDAGRPDMTGLNGGDVAVQDMIAVLDPPANVQPGGTKVEVQFRGAQSFDNSDEIYNPTLDDPPTYVPDDTMAGRGNLLNPNYACEAYRYAMANPGPVGGRVPRINASGLTPYVTADGLDSIRNPVTGLLPRFFNFRLVMENNINSDPAVSPSLRGMALVYRVAPSN